MNDPECRDCGAPLTLLELREMQCEDCEKAQWKRARRDDVDAYWAGIAFDRVSGGDREWDKYQYQEDLAAIRQREGDR